MYDAQEDLSCSLGTKTDLFDPYLSLHKCQKRSVKKILYVLMIYIELISI